MSAVAIVGMACRFGGAANLSEYWDMTLAGRNAFREIPPDRFDADLYYDANRRATDKAYTKTGAFIEDIRSFPGLALGIPPRRLEVMDPQHRFALEMSMHAIEDAGHTPETLPQRTGVFMGVTGFEYRSLLATRTLAQNLAMGAYGHVDDAAAVQRATERLVPVRPYSGPGGLTNMTAAMVAQELDLHGPAFSIDSACASSLVAITTAVQQLRLGAIDAALAGGVYLCVTPENFVVFCRIGAMSQQGLCLPFDERADGFVQGDGAGVVLLKRLEDAERDGDRIYAVIRGVAMNSDGRGDGPMAPHPDGQADVIRAAWADAGVDRRGLGYHEAHGTGTDAGDAAELRGLVAAHGDAVDRVALGSTKANIGHTNSAAGVAGLLRAALTLYHRTIPPLAGFQRAKPELELERTRFFVPTAAERLAAHHRYASVSSFGFGGTNAHAVLEAAPAHDAKPGVQPELILLSAPDETALRDLARRTADAVRADERHTPAAVARTWATRRPQAARAGVVARTREELVERLDTLAATGTAPGTKVGVAERAPKLALLFPGQGAQRVGMLAGIAQRFPVVAAALADAEAALADLLPIPLTHLLYPEKRVSPVDADTARRELTDTAHQQPALFACGWALDRLLASANVRPVVTTGHSLGEFTAAASAGVIDARGAARFVARRGRAMADLPGDHGAMAALRTDAATAAPLLVEGAVIANFNQPRQVVVSGTTAAVEAVVERAATAGVTAVRLDVSHAFHSPVLASLDASDWIAELSASESSIPVASGIASSSYAEAEVALDVFRRHATSPVDFVGALRQCVDAGADLYLQVGAGGPLAAFARACLPSGTKIFTLAGSDDADGGASLLETLAALWCEGVPVDARAFAADAQLATLPPAVLPREEYWLVKDGPQPLAKLPGVKLASTAIVAKPVAPAAAEVAPVPPPTEDAVAERVFAVVAKVSAYPREALRLDHRLQEDLGFDSLMTGDLATGLADAFPGIGGIPQELLMRGPTVADLVAFARTGRDAAAPPDTDDAPLRAWAPTWVPALVETEPLPKGIHVTVVGADAAFADAAVSAFNAAGARAQRADAPTGDLWILHHPLRTQLAQWLAGVGDARPDVLVALPDDPNAPETAATAAFVASVAREWPTSRVKVVIGATPEALVAEAAGSDRTPVVRIDGGRQIPGFHPLDDAPDAWNPGPHECVLVTGGTRGIGARLAARLHAAGCHVALVGRGEPDVTAGELIARGAVHLRADVTDVDALRSAVQKSLSGNPITAVVHAAGVLADGPVGPHPNADAAWNVKVEGWKNAIAVAGPSLRVALGIGSWAGRFGNRHQAWYAAANAALAASTAPCRTVIAEFGPWTDSEMARTIPAPVQQAMRNEGVEFVGTEAGLDALVDDLRRRSGVITHGRDLPEVLRRSVTFDMLAVDTHPYLADHAIAGTPVLPLAVAADAVAFAASAGTAFEIHDLRLYTGIAVREPTRVEVEVRNGRAEVRAGDRRALAYRARVRPATAAPRVEHPDGGDVPPLALDAFERDVLFHGPRLRGIVGIDAVAATFVRGRVKTSAPCDWIPGSPRRSWVVDPLALDGAFQLCAYAAWVHFRRSGTPIGIARYRQWSSFPEGPVEVVVRHAAEELETFRADVAFFGTDGALLAVAEGVTADLAAAEAEKPAEPSLEIKPEWVDPGKWQAIQDLEARLEAASFAGVRNPYFAVHEGTARDTTVVGGRTLVNFSSYNYLGLSGDPRILTDVSAAIQRYGTSVSASRVASGQRPFHADLERELAAAQGTEDAILFTAGHATNVTTIGHLFGERDLVLHDELIHDSAFQGIRLSGASRRAFRHEDPEHLEAQLQLLRRHYEKVLIVVEGVYSMDGDLCNLPAYLTLKRKYGCLLMVDEAHSFGVVGATGRGIGEHHGIDGRDVDLWMGTLSKSLASCGGWIAGSKRLINYLRYTAPGFVYSAGLTPSNGQAALSALRWMLAEPERVQKLQSNATFFQAALAARGIDTGPSRGGSGVVPAITGNSYHALLLSQRLFDQGVNVQPIVYPAVADDSARLRFFLSSTHTEAQLADTATRVADTLGQIRGEFAA